MTIWVYVTIRGVTIWRLYCNLIPIPWIWESRDFAFGFSWRFFISGFGIPKNPILKPSLILNLFYKKERATQLSFTVLLLKSLTTKLATTDSTTTVESKTVCSVLESSTLEEKTLARLISLFLPSYCREFFLIFPSGRLWWTSHS